MEPITDRLKTRVNHIVEEGGALLGIDAQYFMRGGFWLYVAYGTALVRSFVLTIVFANFLPKEIFGQYTFILSVLSIAAIFGIPGLRIGTIRAVARGDEKTYLEAIKTAFRWSWIGTLGLAAMAVYSALLGRDTGFISFAIIAVILPWYTSTGLYDTILIGSHRYKQFAKLSGMVNIILMITTLVAVLVHPWIPTILIASLGFQVILQAVITAYLKKNVMNAKTTASKEDIRYSHKIQIINVLTTVTEYGGMVLMPAFSGFATLASYAIAYKIPQIATNFLKVPVDMFLPKLSKTRRTRQDMRKHFLMLVTVTVASILFLNLAVTPFALNYLFPAYRDSYLLAAALSLVLFSIPNTLTNDLLNSQRNLKVILSMSISVRITSIVLLVVLLPRWGVWAVVVSHVFPRLAQFVFGAFYLFLPERAKTRP